MKYNTNLNKHNLNSRTIPIFKDPHNLDFYNTRFFNFKIYFSTNNVKFINSRKINENFVDNKDILKNNLSFLESISNLINNKDNPV